MTMRKLVGMLLAIIGLQFLLGICILFGLWGQKVEPANPILSLGLGLMLLSSILLVFGLISVTHYQRKSYAESMRDLMKFNEKLREQRHDYLNQLQIVYGLLELEEYEDAREYLRPVFRDIMKVNKALRTAEPAVNALLWAKMEEAKGQGIDFYLDVNTQLAALAMEPWELCKVLGNLLDNAQAAVAGLEGERRISVEIHEETDAYRIQVRNNGPKISAQHQRLIFNQGFTTKKGEGHGMGLSIVQTVLRKAGGSIEFESGDEETTFVVAVPKKRCQLKQKK